MTNKLKELEQLIATVKEHPEAAATVFLDSGISVGTILFEADRLKNEAAYATNARLRAKRQAEGI